MVKDGMLVGELARRTGTTRKALRVYEGAGLLSATRRTAAGYRSYGRDDQRRLLFILKARRAGFSVTEIRDVIRIRESGRTPCGHVRNVIESKLDRIERTLRDLKATRTQLTAMLRGWRPLQSGKTSVCPHIDRIPVNSTKEVER